MTISQGFSQDELKAGKHKDEDMQGYSFEIWPFLYASHRWEYE